MHEITQWLIKKYSFTIIGIVIWIALFWSPGIITYEPIPVQAVATLEVKKDLSIEERVKEAFKDDPVMVAVARCESKFRQWGEDGEALRGVINNKDRGIFQINEIYHLNPALKIGIDILTTEGNIEYAKILYEQSGTRPWDWSRACWGGQE